MPNKTTSTNQKDYEDPERNNKKKEKKKKRKYKREYSNEAEESESDEEIEEELEEYVEDESYIVHMQSFVCTIKGPLQEKKEMKS